MWREERRQVDGQTYARREGGIDETRLIRGAEELVPRAVVACP